MRRRRRLWPDDPRVRLRLILAGLCLAALVYAALVVWPSLDAPAGPTAPTESGMPKP